MRRCEVRGQLRRPPARSLRIAGLLGACALVSTALVGTSAGPGVAAARAAAAQRSSMPVAGDLSTNAVNTSSISVPVPPGVKPKAITAVLTQSEVITGGSVVFSINGSPALAVPSTLYRKVTIPVSAANVGSDDTIALSLASQGAPVAGQTCTPAQGAAAVRKVALTYTGTETAPTSVADFFGATAAAVDVVIPSNASDSMIEAGLTAVDALAARYDDKTPVELTTRAPDAPVASQRVVDLVEGRAGEVTTGVADTAGVPTLTLTGTGDDLVNATRSLSSEALSMSGGDPEDPTTTMKKRSTSLKRSLASLGVSQLDLSGYGTTTQEFQVKQDDFGSPVDVLKMHLVGTHTAFADGAGARVDVRANGNLVGSTTLGSDSDLDLDVTVPSSQLTSVNDIDVSLSALSPSGLACVSPSEPTASVDIDTGSSTVTATRGTGSVEGFQLYPQVFEGTLPIALGPTGKERIQAAIDAANLLVALQRAAAAQLDISVISADTFLADNRSGMLVGAVAQDSVNLDAPLRLSSTRRLKRADSDFAVTSQDPYAALESIDRGNRLVLMLGSWAPGDGAASGAISRKVSGSVVSQQWSTLTGDLFIADANTPAFSAVSRTLTPHTAATKRRSYAGWFIAGIVVLLLLLAIQVVVSVRRDRAKTRARRAAEAAERRGGPAYVEDPDAPEADGFGDLDDLRVTGPDDRQATATPRQPVEKATPPAKKAQPGRGQSNRNQPRNQPGRGKPRKRP